MRRTLPLIEAVRPGAIASAMFFLGERFVKFCDAFDHMCRIDALHALANGAGFGFRDQQERIECGDQAVSIADSGFDLAALLRVLVELRLQAFRGDCATD